METRTYPAKTEELEKVLEFINEKLEEAGAGMKEQMQIAVAVEELFVNVAHYAYDAGSDGPCEVTAGVDDSGMFIIKLKDLGRPFDPLAKADPDVTLSAEDRQIGGLGIFMVKKFMDMITYAREGNRNVVIIGKRFE